MSSKSRGNIRQEHQEHGENEVKNAHVAGASSSQQAFLLKSINENSENSLMPQVSSGSRPVYPNPGAVRVRGPGWDGAPIDDGTVQIGSEGPSVVTDESQQYIPSAAIFQAAPVEYDDDSSKKLSRKSMILLGALILLIVCGGIILGVVFGIVLKDDEPPSAPSSVSNSENSPSPSPTLQPTVTMSPTTMKDWIDAGEISASNGASLALSPSGNQVAVMDSRFDYGTEADLQHSAVVRVYQEEGRAWSQLGKFINVSSTNTSLSLIDNRLAVGANVGVSVYEFQENAWQKIGDTIDGEGWNVKLAQDGSVVAVEEADKVQLYHYNGNKWAPKGAPIPTASTRTNIKSSYSRMDVSSDGKTVIVDQTVHVFSKDLEFYYASPPLMESSPPDTPVSMSRDGKVVAIAQFHANVNGTQSGKVVVFRYNEPEWKQEGDTISNALTNGQFGWSHSLSGNGTRIVIMNNPLSGEGKKAMVLDKRGSRRWVDVLEEVPRALDDGKVAISDEGNRIAVGADGIVAFYDIVG